MFNFYFKRSLSFVSLLTLLTTNLLATFYEAEDEGTRPINSIQHIDQLPEELHLYIFSFLNQEDTSPTAQTSQKWKRLMDDNQLWKAYARRAQIISKEDPFPEKNYKALVREHCIFSFTDLGTLNGGTWSVPRGISYDGSVIVGQAADGAEQNQRRAFRWTAEKGMESLGNLNRGVSSLVLGISANGSVIVGYADDGKAQYLDRTFRWTAEKGMESLGTLNGGSESWAWAISADGSVIVGNAKSGVEQNQRRAFRWTAEKGMESLGNLNRGVSSIARGISYDGSVIVGYATDGAAQDRQKAFRWTAEKGIESLSILNGGSESWAWGISADGLVIVGDTKENNLDDQSWSRTSPRAFRWTAEKGIESLGILNNGEGSWALGVSADGVVIIGQACDGSRGNHMRASYWTAKKGMESVERVLADKGLLPSQWILTKVNAITPSGTVLIGEGTYTDTSNRTLTCAWRAVIPRANLF